VTGSRALRWVAVAAVAVATVLAWIVWRGPRRPDAVAVAPARKLPELNGVLTLSVQLDRRVEVVAGTPIVFDVYLTTGKSAPSLSIGRTAEPWHSLVRLVDDSSGKPLGWALAPLGSPRSIAFAAEQGEAKAMDSTGNVAVVDYDHVHHLVLAASPEATKDLVPGTYAVRALIEGDSRLESAPVTVVVRGAGEAAGGDRLERERMAQSAQFYLLAKRFEDARRISGELAAREPKNCGAWMLLGDALDGLGKPREALAVYRRALAVSPRTYEEPTLLYERMAAMRQKLAS